MVNKVHLLEIRIPKLKKFEEVTEHVAQCIQDYCDENSLPMLKRSKGSRYRRVLESKVIDLKKGYLKYQIKYLPSSDSKSLGLSK
jgi:hypothetical protein